MHVVRCALPNTQTNVCSVPFLRLFSFNFYRLRKITSWLFSCSVPSRAPFLPLSQRLSAASCWLVQRFTSSFLSFPQLFCKMSASLQPSSLSHFQYCLEISLPKAAPSLGTLLRSETYEPSDSCISQSVDLKW